MARPKKGLGGGLGSLFGLGDEEIVDLGNGAPQPSDNAARGSAPNAGDSGPTDSTVDSAAAVDSAAVLLRLIDVCPNPLQPRKNFDEESLDELAESIRRNGVLQPILVRHADPGSHAGKYIIIAGERRWRAARLAELDMIPAVISDADDARSAELALIENLQREDLNPVESALGFRTLAEVYGLKQEEIAERVGRSRPAVANAMRLLNLDRHVLDMLASGEISEGHARVLVPLPPELQREIAKRIVKEKLTVRQVETLVSQLQKNKEPVKPISVDYTAVLAREIGEHIGRKVQIIPGKRKGRIEIEFYGNEDLNALCELLRSTGGSVNE